MTGLDRYIVNRFRWGLAGISLHPQVTGKVKRLSDSILSDRDDIFDVIWIFFFSIVASSESNVAGFEMANEFSFVDSVKLGLFAWGSLGNVSRYKIYRERITNAHL